MNDLIFRIKNSQPTLVDIEARRVFLQMCTNGDYVFLHSKVLGMEEACQIADTYVKALATIKSKTLGELLSFQPIHVLKYSVQLPATTLTHSGLLYSNGCVMYTESSDGSEEMTILLSQELAKEYGFNNTQRINLTKDKNE